MSTSRVSASRASERPAGLSLFEIASEYRAMAAKLQELGADEQTVADTLEAESGDLVDKLAAVVAVALSMEAEARAIDEQVVQRAQRRVEALCRRAERLREYAIAAMVGCELPEVKQPDLHFRVRANPPAVVVTSEGDVPDAFKRTEAVPATERVVIDKAAIREAWKGGAAVPGVRITVGRRLEILPA